MASRITKSVETLSQALSNQNQEACPLYMYQSPHYIYRQTQHSLIQFPQAQRNIAQFQPYTFSNVSDSANIKGG